MRFALATVVLSGYPSEAAFRRAVWAWAGAQGFAGVELSDRWLCDLMTAGAAELAALRAEIDAAGLRVAGLNPFRRWPFGSGGAADREVLLHAVEMAIQLDADVLDVILAIPRGVRRIDYEPDRWPQWVSAAAPWLGELCDRAAAGGVTISFELHDDGPFEDPELLLEVLSALDRPNAGLNPDLANLMRRPSPTPLIETLERLAPKANHWHVKNGRRLSAGDAPQLLPCELWNGDIDYRLATACMRRTGFSAWVAVESYRFGDPLELQVRSLDYLKRTLSSPLPA